MRVVSDTSPISNLAIIGQLDLLKLRYSVVIIPQDVADELSALSHPNAKSRIGQAIASGWIDVKPSAPVDFAHTLDSGESAAIALARAEQADVLLMDEKRGRDVARSLGIPVAGVLGELIHAKRSGLISSLKIEIDRLRTDARFFIAADIEQFVLKEVGE